MIRYQHRFAAWAAALLLAACHSAGAAGKDDDCIRSPETQATAVFTLAPVFTQGQVVTIRTTLTMAVSRLECAASSHVTVRIRAGDPRVALPVVCPDGAGVLQDGKSYFAVLETPVGCSRLAEEGSTYAIRPPDIYVYDDEPPPPFDGGRALEVLFQPSGDVHV